MQDVYKKIVHVKFRWGGDGFIQVSDLRADFSEQTLQNFICFAKRQQNDSKLTRLIAINAACVSFEFIETSSELKYCRQRQDSPR